MIDAKVNLAEIFMFLSGTDAEDEQAFAEFCAEAEGFLEDWLEASAMAETEDFLGDWLEARDQRGEVVRYDNVITLSATIGSEKKDLSDLTREKVVAAFTSRINDIFDHDEFHEVYDLADQIDIVSEGQL